MPDREKVIATAIEQLDWYFNEDDGGAAERITKIAYQNLKDSILAILKEQEAVEPIGGYGYYICGVCKNPLNSASQKFCSECGRKVKYDD